MYIDAVRLLGGVFVWQCSIHIAEGPAAQALGPRTMRHRTAPPKLHMARNISGSRHWQNGSVILGRLIDLAWLLSAVTQVALHHDRGAPTHGFAPKNTRISFLSSHARQAQFYIYLTLYAQHVYDTLPPFLAAVFGTPAQEARLQLCGRRRRHI